MPVFPPFSLHCFPLCLLALCVWGRVDWCINLPRAVITLSKSFSFLCFQEKCEEILGVFSAGICKLSGEQIPFLD